MVSYQGIPDLNCTSGTLHKAVSYANFGKLRFKTEGEQQIWNECGRLIANCIIFYNATILSNLLRHQALNIVHYS